MKLLFAVFCLLQLTACSHFKSEDKSSVLRIGNNTYTFQLYQKPNGQVFIQTSLSKEGNLLPLFLSQKHDKVFESPDDFNGTPWHHSEFTEIQFSKIYLTPYYGLFSYGALSNLREYEGGIFNPECEFTTKYLLIVYHNKKMIPIFGCVE